jgi:hypothetical protein
MRFALERELGWKYYGGKHFESIYTRFFQGYILPRKWGFDKRRSHYSSLICSGEMTREEALDELRKPPYPVDQQRADRVYVAKKLGLSETEFEAILALPDGPSGIPPTDAFTATARSCFCDVSGREG